MLDPLPSLHLSPWRRCSHMLSIRLSSFLLLVARSPIVASPTDVLMRGRFQMARLHQATRERWQRRLQLLPRSMHRVTTAAHVLDPRLLLALSLHRSITTVWPCSFQRRYGPLARCTLPLPHLHQDQGLCSVLLRQRVLKS